LAARGFSPFKTDLFSLDNEGSTGLSSGSIFDFGCSIDEMEGVKDFVYLFEHVAAEYNIETTVDTYRLVQNVQNYNDKPSKR